MGVNPLHGLYAIRKYYIEIEEEEYGSFNG